jgi:MFS transporter, DHA1 family, multidrug resistance protein
MPYKTYGLGLRPLALIIGMLSSIGPFAIDTYLPAFAQISKELGASETQMQLTITAYLLTFSIMNLFHGAVSDAVGRRTVILTGLGLFAFASFGAATSQSIEHLLWWRVLQGVAGGAGSTVGRAVARDLTDGADAQRLMSQASMAFAIAPAIAPIIGGLVLLFAGWRAIFVVLGIAALSGAIAVYRYLPESLPVARRQPLALGNLATGYWYVLRQSLFWRLSLVVTLTLSGFLVYIFGAPQYLSKLLAVSPQGFAVMFLPLTLGTLIGSAISSRAAGRLSLRGTVHLGMAICLAAGALHCAVNVWVAPSVPWSFVVMPLYTAGAAVLLAPVNIMLLDVAPDRKGMVSSCHAFLQSSLSGVSAAILVPYIWHSTLSFALTTLTLTSLAALVWLSLQSGFSSKSR